MKWYCWLTLILIILILWSIFFGGGRGSSSRGGDFTFLDLCTHDD